MRQPRLWPTFDHRLRSTAITARVGRLLGITFGVCFVTGLLSHYQYHPWTWLPVPATPAWGYRLTQGLHVMTGIATIPLLLVKLWSVFPLLFQWPPARSVVHALERLSIAVLVSSALVEVTTGLLNILQWYPWTFGFVSVHHWLAYVVAGSVLLHLAVKLPVVRRGLAEPVWKAPARSGGGISRRGVLIASGAGVGVVALTTVGQVIPTLEPLALLAPRRPKRGPLGVPINKTAASAGIKVPASYRLTVLGPRPFDLDVPAIEALPFVERHIPLACVEGWSVSARWGGASLFDLVRRVGGDGGSTVQVVSLQQGGFGTSTIRGSELRGALLATHLNGRRITLDHGYPVRLIAPDRAGVLNTKWVTRLEIR
jgi:DMSO/TMAO reductase YedYZ molybdopterin-dependent catalytic subunit